MKKLLLLAALLFATPVFGDGINGGGTVSFSSIAGSTCTFSSSGLENCPIGPTTQSTGSFGTTLRLLNNSSFNGLAGHPIAIITSPTISSGFGTSPTVVSHNGTFGFSVNVGTGGTATGGVIGLSTATTEWECIVQPFNPSAAQLLNTTYVSARTTTSVTLTNAVTSTGVATAWPASQVLMIQCIGT